jgi:hypothetical protein
LLQKGCSLGRGEGLGIYRLFVTVSKKISRAAQAHMTTLHGVEAWITETFHIENLDTSSGLATVNFLLVSGQVMSKIPSVAPIQRKHDSSVIASHFGWHFFQGQTLIQRTTEVPFLTLVCGGEGTAEMAQFLLNSFPTVGPKTTISTHPADHAHTMLDFAAGTGNKKVLNVLLAHMGYPKYHGDISEDHEDWPTLSHAFILAARTYDLPTVEAFLDAVPTLSYLPSAESAISAACSYEVPSRKGTVIALATLLIDHDVKTAAFHFFVLREFVESSGIEFPKELFPSILCLVWNLSFFLLPPSSFLLSPSPSSFLLPPSSFLLPSPSSFLLPPSSFSSHSSSCLLTSPQIHRSDPHPFFTSSNVFCAVAWSRDLKLLKFLVYHEKFSEKEMLPDLLIILAGHLVDVLSVLLEAKRVPLDGVLPPGLLTRPGKPHNPFLAPDSSLLHYAYAYCDPDDPGPGMKLVKILEEHGALHCQNSDRRFPVQVLGALHCPSSTCMIL